MLDGFLAADVLGFETGVEIFIGKFEAKMLDGVGWRSEAADAFGLAHHDAIAALKLNGFTIFLQLGEFGHEFRQLSAEAAFL